MTEQQYTSNILARHTLMDGRGQEVIYPNGATYIVYANEGATYSVWRRCAVERFMYLSTVPTMDAARRVEVDDYEQRPMRDALEAARHELTTLHGLTATDQGGDVPEGGWRIDTNAVIARIDDALAAAAGRGADGEAGE